MTRQFCNGVGAVAKVRLFLSEKNLLLADRISNDSDDSQSIFTGDCKGISKR